MALANVSSPFADHLRWWRHHRRLSQLDLAGLADVSAKHISFLEVGRSQPSREMVLHLAASLDVPLRHRNELLAAAGFAPAYRTDALDEHSMADVRRVVSLHLEHHEPFPAVCVDRHWNVLDANDAAGLFLERVDPALLAGPINVMRLSLHPDGLSRLVQNFDRYAAHLVEQLRAQVSRTLDAGLAELLDEVTGYPNVPDAQSHLGTDTGPMLPLVLDVDGTELSFVSTIATIGAPNDVTTAELAIEAFYPGDDTTRTWLERRQPAAPT